MFSKVTLCVLYLAAIVAANLVIAKYGADAVLYVAIVFVAFVLVARDRLHDLFGEKRALKLGALILAGAILSYVFSADAKQIAIASAVAFGVSELLDTLVYFALRRTEWLERSNVSNVVGAVSDTAVFFWLVPFNVAFSTMLAQAACKIAGGFIFSLALRRRLHHAHA